MSEKETVENSEQNKQLRVECALGAESLDKINMKLEIRRNSDGTIATDIWRGWEYNTYWWEEGNASCDCNRELFFCRALKLPEPDEIECGDGKYSVRLSDADTLEVLYSEF